jgi:protease-4
MLWELREKLEDFKASGKTVVVFIDQADINLYHFASVADKIVMDPYGMLSLEGFVSGRTFVKGTLEKLGVGYDEWRYFTYKSASEAFSREAMSEADREQRQKLVDDFYMIAKEDICKSRTMSADRFDDIVNNVLVMRPEEAVKQGLVDEIGRWDSAQDIVAKIEGTKKPFLFPGSLYKFQLPYDNEWSEPPRIAVIYAEGVCAMDAGISARTLINEVNESVDDPTVKAIVLRVDSPGGDPQASDYISNALRRAKGKKPVIVSQGSVAASGGYWLSMYADTIVAAPQTITGSIGVIGGWFYDTGFKKSIGLSTDYVKAGEHADLGFGFSLPLIGTILPDRNLTDEERSKTELLLKDMYKDFVKNVASGREMPPDQIEKIAQGRVWSGLDGKANGLVDVLGGLETAIRIAKSRAGIPHDQRITVVEKPARGWFNIAAMLPQPFGTSEPDDFERMIEHVKFRIDQNGKPLLMLPLEDMDLVMPK